LRGNPMDSRKENEGVVKQKKKNCEAFLTKRDKYLIYGTSSS